MAPLVSESSGSDSSQGPPTSAVLAQRSRCGQPGILQLLCQALVFVWSFDSRSRGASEAAKVWQATQRQAMRIKPRPAWQPRDEAFWDSKYNIV